jgi:RNA polymerase sigma factor (sigma-70 family)
MTPLLAQRPRSDRAFERLYEKHVGDVYRYALVVLRNPADAEDVTQTTFLNAYRAFSRGERPRAPQNWLMAIAHNVCRQRFRQAARRPSEVALEDDVAEFVPEDRGPTADDIRRALGHLAFNQRAALVMRELEGRSYQEIADILGLSTSAVETLIFRARRALREQLEGGLTCHEAELAVSKQLDGRLGRKDRGALRAHLRECEECSRFARSQRAQRTAIKALAAIPLPTSLSSFFGGSGGGAAAGAGAAAGTGVATGVAAKVALVGATAAVATGVGYEGVKRAGWHPLTRSHPARVAQAGSPTASPSTDRAKPVGRSAPETNAAVAPAKKVEHKAPSEQRSHGKVGAPGQLKKAVPLRPVGAGPTTGKALGHENQHAPKAKIGPAVRLNPPATRKGKVGPAVKLNPPARRTHKKKPQPQPDKPTPPGQEESHGKGKK